MSEQQARPQTGINGRKKPSVINSDEFESNYMMSRNISQNNDRLGQFPNQKARAQSPMAKISD